MTFLLNISLFSPDILYLALPPMITSQILYPKAIINVVSHYICCCFTLFQTLHLYTSSIRLKLLLHNNIFNIGYVHCTKHP